ncbi:hypothetical protein CPS_2753 [Colwellia psychrerythraea 34H]|uniref:DUF4267 domain-containing protein n=2 Tax=Colwelliaceae TaxID=267889 RepID=Q480Q4_COLP3|nr:hypothetical protein CPS_2753 [Colwellia psychrerythraea 34H]
MLFMVRVLLIRIHNKLLGFSIIQVNMDIMTNKSTKLEKVGFVLVALIVLLQGFYGTFAFIDPTIFSAIRGTELFSSMDADWVKIYGSRTIFITLIFGYLLYTRNYIVLMWGALFAVVMPITDGLLAYEAQAPLKVVAKHVVTIVYLLIIFFVLKKVIAQKA